MNVKLYTEQFGFYSNKGKRLWNIQPGTFTISVGASSQDIRLQQDITLTGETVTKSIREFYFSESSVK